MFDAIVAARENRPLKKPTAMNDLLWELIQKCWQVAPMSRPTASDIIQHLILQLKASQQGENHTHEWDDGDASSAISWVPGATSTVVSYPESDESISSM